MARQVAKKTLKIDPVLVGLGRAIEVRIGGANPCVIKWTTKDKVMLYSSNNGKRLFCIRTTPKAITQQKLSDEISAKRAAVSKAVDLYSDWTDFDDANGCLIATPRGSFHRLGNCAAILYASNKWTGTTKHYVHDFKKCPTVWANNKTAPTVVLLSGGQINVRPEGITG